MERIRAAIYKAKKDRKPHTKSAGHQSAVTSPVAEADFRGFTETAVVSPSDKVLRKNHVVAAFSNTREADHFRFLRTKVSLRMQEKGFKTLGICSARDGEGKTVVAINLGITISSDLNRSVLLVDLDLRKPSLSEYLDLKPEKGLNDYLKGRAQLSECLINPGIQRFVVLPTRKSSRVSSELLHSPMMTELAMELRERYSNRVIIYDLPPLLLVDDGLAFLPNLDCCLQVAEEGRTTKSDLLQVKGLIPRERYLGCVLNKAVEDLKDYSYYY